MEQWKIIEGYSAYEVSNSGRVRRVDNGKILTGGLEMMHGYHRYKLRGDDGVKRGLKAHRLVATAFIPNDRPDRNQVAHWNGVRDDNRVENLRWATLTENQADRLRHGTSTKGVGNGRAVLTDGIVCDLRKRASREQFDVREEAAKLGVSLECIRHAVRGRTWTHVN